MPSPILKREKRRIVMFSLIDATFSVTSSAPSITAASIDAVTGTLRLTPGSGTGTSTAAMAAEEPDVDVIAVEVYRRGLAQLLGAVDRAALTNVRLIRGDGTDVQFELGAPQPGVITKTADPQQGNGGKGTNGDTTHTPGEDGTGNGQG